MKKKKMIAVAALSLLGLAACNPEKANSSESSFSSSSTESSKAVPSSSKPKTFDEMYDELKHPMTVTGSAKVILIDTKNNDEITQNNTIKVLFGEKSFHIEQSGESESIVSSIYTDDTGKALHYYIDQTNTVQHEVIKDKEGNDVLFKEYDNPFKYVESSIFTLSGDKYIVDLTNKDIKDDYNYMVNNLTYINFPNLAEKVGDTFEDISLKIENEHIVGMHILSKAFTDTLGTTKFEWDLSFDYSSTTNHDYAIPSKLETKEYHKTLKAALDKLINATEPYLSTFSVDYGYAIYNYQSYFDGTFVYVADKDYPDDYKIGYIKKDDGVHEITKANDKFYYKEDAEEKIAWGDVTPSYAVAVEWFTYDESTGVYTFSNSSYGAGAFGYKMTSLGLIDSQIAASSSVKITLSSDKSHVEKMVFGDDTTITATFSYGVECPFGFKGSELTPANIYTSFEGTYTAKIDDSTTFTIVVSATDKTVKINDTLCTDVKTNSYGELEFTYNGVSYSISKNKTKLYNNTDGGWYNLTANN